MRAVLIIGTRAELIKVFPVLKELRSRDHQVHFVSTGQHKLDSTCEMLGVKKPDKVLTETVEDSSKFNGSKLKAVTWNIKLLMALRKEIKSQNPDYVLYHGDTMSTASAALSSSRVMFPFRSFRTAHIEAGLRSGSLREPFPEEISRIMADSLSNIMFSVSEVSTDNVSKYRYFGKVYNTGNTIVDSVTIGSDTAKFTEDYAVATIHRHENISSKERMEKILEILNQSPYTVKFFMHDNTRNLLEEYGLMQKIEDNSEIQVRELEEYPEFLGVLKNSSLIYTDGGSIQEESLIFKVPCVILRKRTERKEGLETELNFLSKLDPDRTQEYVDSLQDIERDIENPYGKEGAPQRIVEKLEEELQ